MLLYTIILFLFTFPCTMSMNNNISKRGCPSECGNITVPYPFGIGKGTGCSLDDSFYVTCNTTIEPGPQLFFQSSNIRIHDINISNSNLRIFTHLSYICYNQQGFIEDSLIWNFTIVDQFTFSEKNKFTVIGCDDVALIKGQNEQSYSSGCIGLCSEAHEVHDGKCSGDGCCQTSITKGLKFYSVTLQTYRSHKDVWPFNPCGYAFLAEESSFHFDGIANASNYSEFSGRLESSLLVAIDWVISPDQTCSGANVCQENSNCTDMQLGGGYLCQCVEGYEGNPYLGCQDINECERLDEYPCNGTCVNTIGGYNCKCKDGYSGHDANKDGCRRESFPIFRLSLVLLGSSVIYYTAKRRQLLLQRQKFFEQNGGMLLEDKLKANRGLGVGSMKIFRVEELDEATDDYAKENILGKGGNGIVYKGTLPDKRIVAIKKSQRLDEGQREQFINEMVILTQINHQNVVQLLGCCLETDVPLLAYEFVSNDTLHHHIHDKKSDIERLSWNSRLRIAHESAGALAYLHTDARMSIIHRDVKSANILLDDNYTAKIADFGASRLVPLGHDQVTTMVQGTFGYLDPEYFHTGQLTDKSDVYSFGVVLTELLTGEKPLGVERSLKERNLATYFVKAKRENRLFEIVDREVAKEAPEEQIVAACDLACRCLNLVGVNRPSMKEVTMELEIIRKLGKNLWVNEDSYNNKSSLMIESKDMDLYHVPLITNSDTFGSSSSTTAIKETMLRVQSPR
ncbi:wall-associated receptor kinase 2-like isoform X2 [Rutidosis leptorrhynchoides]|uniref:wall-associated receptor kinase 2-like isoform X2 n=1 Tax=Rutidosis leptorrhynchoides TaxID=125765 RepID=UPI003A99552B